MSIIRKRYRLEATEDEATGRPLSLRCYNEQEQREAPHDLPAEISYYPSGNVEYMVWCRAGKWHRDNDLPAIINFKDTQDLRITRAAWRQHGREHREGYLPSEIGIDEEDGRVCLLRFCRRGEECGVDGLPPHIWINADGSTEDENGYPISVDLSRFDEDKLRSPQLNLPPFYLTFS